MSTSHQGGNIQPGLDLEEHNGSINAKRVDASGATVFAVVNTGAPGVGESMVTLYPGPNFIGIVTVTNKDRTITGNLTLSDAKTFIGLTTTTLGASPAFIGITTVANRDRTITGNMTLSDAKTGIGLVSVFGGKISIDGNVTLSDPKTGIGLVSVFGGKISIDGNVTLSDPKTFIGLVTAVPAYRAASTIFTFIASNASHTTIFQPPSNERWYLKNLILGSAGDVRAEVRSGATQFIPYISLATSGGYVMGPDQEGIPSRANNDAFVVGLQSAVTVSGMANVYFKAG